jgi:phage terminase large subunit-like protein
MKWASHWLLQPDRPIAGQQWVFTEEQMRFIAWWYAIDEAGRWRYTYGVLRRMKGWGKDPLAAVLSAIEFVGPCRFGGWQRGGQPIVVPQPSAWVQIAATAKEQTRNTMVLFPSLLSKAAVQEYGIDVGKEIIYAEGGRRQIQAVTSSPKTIEGARSTFVVLNESQHWLDNNDGSEMAKAIRRNSAKVGGRGLAITNAHRIGEGSVAERDWEKYLADGDAGEILYDSLEAPADTDIADDESLRAGLLAARGDSAWVPIDRLMIDSRDERDSEVYRRRFYLNQIRQETNTWITAAEWAAAERAEDVPTGTLITLGFDGARFQDTTALVATVVATGYQWVVGLWQRPDLPGEWEVPADEVDLAVDGAFERYNVCRFHADPYWWEETIARWMGRRGEDVVRYLHTNRQMARMTRSLKAYETAVRTGELGHEASPAFAAHIASAVKREVNLRDEDGERLYTISKEHKGSPRKIDIAMAAVLSWGARAEALAAGAGQAHAWSWGAV